MIEVEHLHKNYGAVEAVRDVSFRVDAGSIVGVLGPNGAGKSTTLRVLAGFLGATKGHVRIGGHDIAEERMQAVRKIGYMPETSPLYPEMRVAEYLRFRAELKGIAQSKRAAEIERVLQSARLTDMAPRLIAHLSKGYRQRVGLADALLGSPPLLILDEPSAGLDPNQIREVRELIVGLGERHTVLLSTHILSEVEATCSRVIVISKGRLVAKGAIDEIRNQAVGDQLVIVVGGDADKARELLERDEQIATWKATPSADGNSCRLVLRLKDGDADSLTERLVAKLVGAGLGIREVLSARASLEQVFSQLTAERSDREEQRGDEPRQTGDEEKPA